MTRITCYQRLNRGSLRSLSSSKGLPTMLTTIGSRRQMASSFAGLPASSVDTSQLGSSTTNDTYYRTNGGTVEGVWIFCRHGDRSPGRCLSPAHRQADEAAFWISRLPYPSTFETLESLAVRYTPQIATDKTTRDGEGTFLDTRRNPFGFLTQKGIFQLKEIGSRFFNRYNRHGYHSPDLPHWSHRPDFLEAWEVRVYSTNYVRTILSAQSFLDGFFGTHLFAPSLERTMDPTVSQEQPVPSHEWAAQLEPSSSWQIPIHVRALPQDPLNAFDRNPKDTAAMVHTIMTSPDFVQRDSGAAPLGARLANILPGLIRPRRDDFSSRSPSGINWVEAADHFVCRDSHGLPLARFTDFEKDERVEQTLRAMALSAKVHLSWRFRQWYQHKPLLAAVAAPPLREVLQHMRRSVTEGKRRPFALYSCHDITILGLLYGIGAGFLAPETGTNLHYWPPYASTLAFELVRMDDEDSKNQTNADGKYFIRVLLDGRTIMSVDFDKSKNPSIGSGVDSMMAMDDLEMIVSQLEDVGGENARL